MLTLTEPISPSFAQISAGIDLDEPVNLQRQRVLVVEDDPDTNFLLKHILRSAGFDVLGAANGREAVNRFAENQPDLVILDLMMPEMDGWETLSKLRQMCNVPVVIISAVAMKDEIVRALQIGVDDFITKPFYNSEVTARIAAVLRRTGTTQNSLRLAFPKIGLMLDLSSQEVLLDNHLVQLTPREFSVLASLAHHAPSLVHYEAISREVWGTDSMETRNRTKFLIYRLRKKLQLVKPDRDFIINIDRIGYKLIIGTEEYR